MYTEKKNTTTSEFELLNHLKFKIDVRKLNIKIYNGTKAHFITTACYYYMGKL